jgi:hypothetical protein
MAVRDEELEHRLRALRDVPVPPEFATTLMGRLSRERRLFGLPLYEWAVIGGSLCAFGVTLQLMVTWAAARMYL